MNDSTRTLTFVGVAAVLAVAAYGMHVATQPVSLKEFSDVGDEFYPDFKNPGDATGLRVAAYNKQAARVDVFNVEFKDGLWRIPSHHNYPADGEKQLAKTATSIIGLQREALVSTSRDDEKRLGVLDPLDETVTGTEGRGDRITLTKGDQVLADYIIGTKVEDGPNNVYHVRRADEDRTYLVSLDVDISTKFADWIEPDLLDFRRGDLRELVVDRYSIDETRGVLVPGEISKLTHTSETGPWTLEGLDEATGKVNNSTVNKIINALENLKIVGVRAKPAGLSADLKGEGDGGIDGRDMLDLEQKGFFVDSRGALVSNEGDVRVAMADGVMYVLRFGEVFTGTDVEIEVGNSAGKTTEDAEKPDGQDTPGSGENTAESGEAAENGAAKEDDTDAAGKDDSLNKSRYVFITAQFDESVIEPLPEQPVKPEPPADVTPKADAEQPADGDAASQPSGDDAKQDAGGAETTPEPEASADGDDAAAAPEKADGDSKEEGKPDPEAEYKQALAKYEQQQKDWDTKQKQREAKIAAGKKRVQELNSRFAGWYYVISAKTFDDIHISPDALIEKVEPKADDTAPDKAAPAEEKDESPAAEETSSPEKPAAESAPGNPDQPAEEKSVPEDATPEGSATEKPSDVPADGKPPAGDDASSDKSSAETPRESSAGASPDEG